MSEWNTGKMRCDSKDTSSELSIEVNGTDLDSFQIFSENLSPIPAAIVPRKLDFSGIEDDESLRGSSPPPVSLSPPYKRVRALRLFDSPHTPKTIIEKCSTPTHHATRSRLFPPGSGHYLHPPREDDSALDSLPPDEALDDSGERSRYQCRRAVANINPFTPDGQLLNKKKRALSKTPTLWGSTTPEQPAKRLRESNISRYNIEFIDLGLIGTGHFGRVTKCMNKLDGCVYAIKRSLRPVAGSAAERTALTEVYAHAVLGKHPHVVRYYSAWAEDDHMVIQSEYCDGGSLQEKIQNGPLSETELLKLLAHIADGLKYIHSQHLVHMDVKPENIFICGGGGNNNDPHDSADDGFDDDDVVQDYLSYTTYKIGDLGHVTCLSSPTVEEGDCRYLPKEVLQEDLQHLTKADIFAFGLTVFEAAGGGPLPKNGEVWQAYRDGKLPDLPNLSREFNQLLKKMVDPDPSARPSAARILKHPLLHPAGNKSKSQLRRELAAAKLKNELLTRKLQEAARCIKSLAPNVMSSQDSIELRTRSARRAQQSKCRVDNNIVEMIQAVTSPVRGDRGRRDRRIRK